MFLLKQKNVIHVYRKFYNLMKETWLPQYKFRIPQTKLTVNKEPDPSFWQLSCLNIFSFLPI